MEIVRFGAWQEMHKTAWTVVGTYRASRYPVFGGKSTADLDAELPKPLEDWLNDISQKCIGGRPGLQ